MAVITQVTLEEAQEFCKNLNLNIIALNGIIEGTENSTFLLEDSNNKKYILSLYEQGNLEDINFICNLQAFLNKNDLPVLAPKTHKNGDFFALLKNKPALVFDFAEGETYKELDINFGIQAANYLAKQHKITANYREKKAHLRYINYIEKKATALAPYLTEAEKLILDEELNLYQQELASANLPEAVLHGDLFRDNVFFISDNNKEKTPKLSAVIDFYNSCTGARLYDLAVLICDWSIDENSVLHTEIYDKILIEYKKIIKFSLEEEKLWQFMLRLVATRYWISRLLVMHIEDKSDRVAKDPNHFKKILINLKKQKHNKLRESL